MSNAIRIKGLEGLNKKLKQIPPKMRGKALRNALRAGAKLIERDAKSRVPTRTGKLKRNITTKVYEYKTGAQHAFVGANMPDGAHIHLVEYGTSSRVLKGTRVRGRGRRRGIVQYKYPAGTRRGRMPSKPFLRPAFDSQREAALAKIAAELDRALTRAVG